MQGLLRSPSFVQRSRAVRLHGGLVANDSVLVALDVGLQVGALGVEGLWTHTETCQPQFA